MATYSFSVDEKSYPRLIHWLESWGRGERSREICKALDAWVSGQSVTHSDIHQEVREIRRMLEQGLILSNGGNHREASEPADVAAALDNLGLG
jgi:hypothetical protein